VSEQVFLQILCASMSLSATVERRVSHPDSFCVAWPSSQEILWRRGEDGGRLKDITMRDICVSVCVCLRFCLCLCSNKGKLSLCISQNESVVVLISRRSFCCNGSLSKDGDVINPMAFTSPLFVLTKRAWKVIDTDLRCSRGLH
jgi:hypothetical protein